MLLVHGVPVSGIIERAWHDHPHDDMRGWIEVSYVASGIPVRRTQMVEGAVYRRAREIVDRDLPVRVLHAARAPDDHIILELMP